MRKFNPSSQQQDRAFQAWLILVNVAMHRQTLTYEGLSMAMYGRKAQGVLDKILGHIAFYCIDNRLPPLTSIVVGKRRGTPGADIPMDLNRRDAERERVYSTDWYDIYPPSAKELHESYDKHRKTTRKWITGSATGMSIIDVCHEAPRNVAPGPMSLWSGYQFYEGGSRTRGVYRDRMGGSVGSLLRGSSLRASCRLAVSRSFPT
jgi:hypothetical protein